MSIELATGKLYTLRFSDSEADVESFIEGISKLSGDYKLIGVGMIPSKEQAEENANRGGVTWEPRFPVFEYYLFKNCISDEIVEVFKNDGEYGALTFFKRDVVTLGSYSDYLEYGWEEFPEFAGPNCDCVVNVDIRESSIPDLAHPLREKVKEEDEEEE